MVTYYNKHNQYLCKLPEPLGAPTVFLKCLLAKEITFNCNQNKNKNFSALISLLYVLIYNGTNYTHELGNISTYT